MVRCGERPAYAADTAVGEVGNSVRPAKPVTVDIHAYTENQSNDAIYMYIKSRSRVYLDNHKYSQREPGTGQQPKGWSESEAAWEEAEREAMPQELLPACKMVAAYNTKHIPGYTYIARGVIRLEKRVRERVHVIIEGAIN